MNYGNIKMLFCYLIIKNSIKTYIKHGLIYIPHLTAKYLIVIEMNS